MMETKLQTLKEAAARQNWQGALRIAAKFANLGEHKAAIVRGHEAHANARFAAQLGRVPAADIEAGIAVLCARYSLNRDGSENTAPKAYGAKNNCIRAARKALGSEAQPGVDFELACGEAGWTWAAAPALPAVVEALEPVIEAPQAQIEAPKAPAEPAPAAVKAPRASSEAVQAKRRAMLAAADAKGFGARWNAALEAARAGELPAAPDFSKPTHVSGRKWLAEAVALQAAGDIEGLRGLVYDPEGSTGGALHRFVRFSIAALAARAGVKVAA